MMRDAVLKIHDEDHKTLNAKAACAELAPARQREQTGLGYRWLNSNEKFNCKPLPDTIMKLRETNASYLES